MNLFFHPHYRPQASPPSPLHKQVKILFTGVFSWSGRFIFRLFFFLSFLQLPRINTDDGGDYSEREGLILFWVFLFCFCMVCVSAWAPSLLCIFVLLFETLSFLRQKRRRRKNFFYAVWGGSLLFLLSHQGSSTVFLMEPFFLHAHIFYLHTQDTATHCSANPCWSSL